MADLRVGVQLQHAILRDRGVAIYAEHSLRVRYGAQPQSRSNHFRRMHLYVHQVEALKLASAIWMAWSSRVPPARATDICKGLGTREYTKPNV
ncbi:hypothetical protein ANN_22719 [Periplaneta americana]|uniref:Uncharacterized protein n=1 Tax=Periplaneta americana TaxID=6978 RepID=A0ABQ8SJ64_PERAM|nr:hypothetical protein ANN_22719 [Periplaneta americana]